MIQRFAGGLLVLLAATPAVPADGDSLYRWTDDLGRTHFSDRPPATASPPRVERFRAPSYADSGVPDDHFSVTNQLKRMQTERLERERERREREQAAREQALREREVAAAELAAEQAAGRESRAGVIYAPPWGSRYPHRGRPHRPHPPRQVRPPSLWEPDHPAYRAYPRHPRGRPVPYMREGF